MADFGDFLGGAASALGGYLMQKQQHDWEMDKTLKMEQLAEQRWKEHMTAEFQNKQELAKQDQAARAQEQTERLKAQEEQRAADRETKVQMFQQGDQTRRDIAEANAGLRRDMAEQAKGNASTRYLDTPNGFFDPKSQQYLTDASGNVVGARDKHLDEDKKNFDFALKNATQQVAKMSDAQLGKLAQDSGGAFSLPPSDVPMRVGPEGRAAARDYIMRTQGFNPDAIGNRANAPSGLRGGLMDDGQLPYTKGSKLPPVGTAPDVQTSGPNAGKAASKHGAVVRTGRDAQGKRVVQYEDGFIEAAQ